MIDEWSRESLAIEVDASLSGAPVKRAPERLHIVRGGAPAVIEIDNGPSSPAGTRPSGLTSAVCTFSLSYRDCDPEHIHRLTLCCPWLHVLPCWPLAVILEV